jgi:hypothetical protein
LLACHLQGRMSFSVPMPASLQAVEWQWLTLILQDYVNSSCKMTQLVSNAPLIYKGFDIIDVTGILKMTELMA